MLVVGGEESIGKRERANRPDNEGHSLLNVAIVGGGPGCKAIMDMIFAEKLGGLRMKLLGVADLNPEAVGYRYAREKKIYTTNNFYDLYNLKGLNMIIELTGLDEAAGEISRTKPNHVRLMDHVVARVFWDVFRIEEEQIAERKWSEEERQKLNAQLQRAQKMEAIGTLAGGIAHNFNNLLMVILTRAGLIRSKMDPSDPSYEMLKDIERQVERGAKLTSQLLGYAREGRYEVKPINLNQLVEETSDAFAEMRKEITVRQQLSEDLFAIEADQEQVTQVLLNLYLNAADAMPDGGVLILKTMNIAHDAINSRLFNPKPGTYVHLEITDDGIGMDEETMGRIFEPFFTTKEVGKGTGLGLPSAYGTIKSHGGYIDVESKKGYGTTFNLYFPALEKKIVQETVAAAPREITRGTGTILLVDDEKAILDVVREYLEIMGYRVLTVTGGNEAIQVYRQKRDEIDMVLLDMVMPHMSGWEIYDCLREINPDVKVLLLSGYTINGEATGLLKRGCKGFMQKPFDMSELSEKIREILRAE